MYHCRVVSTTPSKPSAFASTITREETSILDPNGVWQKDRGGKFNNFLIIDLEIQDSHGSPVPLDFFVDLECSLRIVMENGDFGGVLDTVNRTSKRLMSKHLEGQSGKLVVIDADPITGSGIRVGGNSRTSVKVRINELSKKGSKNSRYSVCFRAAGPGSELFVDEEDSRMTASLPLTIYSKVVKTSNYIASAAAAAAAAAVVAAVTSGGSEDQHHRQLHHRGSGSSSGGSMGALSPAPGLPLPSSSSSMRSLHSAGSNGGAPPHQQQQQQQQQQLAASSSSASSTMSSAAGPLSSQELEMVKSLLDQALGRLNEAAYPQADAASSSSSSSSRLVESHTQQLILIYESCSAIMRRVEARIKHIQQQQQQQAASEGGGGSRNHGQLAPSSHSLASPPPAAAAHLQQHHHQLQQQQYLAQLDNDLMTKIPLTSSANTAAAAASAPASSSSLHRSNSSSLVFSPLQQSQQQQQTAYSSMDAWLSAATAAVAAGSAPPTTTNPSIGHNGSSSNLLQQQPRSLDASWAAGGGANSAAAAAAAASAIQAMFPPPPGTASATAAAAAAGGAGQYDDSHMEKRLRMAPESSLFQKFLNNVTPGFVSSSAFSSMVAGGSGGGGEVSTLQHQPSSSMPHHSLRHHASSSSNSVDFEELKNILDNNMSRQLLPPPLDLQLLGGRRRSSDGAAALLMDRDGLTRAFAASTTPLTDSVREWIFRTFDADGDGLVSASDFATVLASRQTCIADVFRQFDVTGGGGSGVVCLGDLDRAARLGGDHAALHLLLDASELEGGRLHQVVCNAGNAGRTVSLADLTAMALDSPGWSAVLGFLQLPTVAAAAGAGA